MWVEKKNIVNEPEIYSTAKVNLSKLKGRSQN